MSAQYKSAHRTQTASDTPDSFKYRKECKQLQELFPTWTNDGVSTSPTPTCMWSYSVSTDLQTLLVEVSGDVQLAATRITDGEPLFHRFTPRRLV